MDRISLLAALSVLVALASMPATVGAVLPGETIGPAAISGGQTASLECSFPLTLRDAGRTQVTVEVEPERVVTLNPSAAQTMWEIGAREKVVGLTKYAAYLEGASSRTNVSGKEQIVVLERVVALEPDLVLAPNTVTPETVGKLREAGVTVYHFPEAESIDDVLWKVSTIGRLVGECEGAHKTVAWMRERLAVVDKAVAGQERPSVLYLFFGYTAGEGTFIHEVIERAGGDNLAADVGVSGYRQLSQEVVVDRDPKWIILNSQDPALPDSPAVRGTTAVKHNQTVIVQIEHINQPAPRVVYAIETLVKTFHPEAYARANATASPTPTDTAKPPSPGDGSISTAAPKTTATPGQPGLGAAVTIAALVVFFITGRRWRL